MLELRILTGLHRGATLPLEGDAIRIGRATENDLILLDPGMPAVAGVIDRFGDSTWQYRSTLPSDDAFDAASQGTALVAGARWFAGPVLLGCEKEGTPWLDEPVLSAGARHDECAKRPASVSTMSKATFVAAIGIAVLVGVLAWRSRPGVPARLPAVQAPPAQAMSDASRAPLAPAAPVRAISATLYPNKPAGRPPFTIRSAISGPYGFVVTDDDHILIPGSRWGAFTLVRIEPGRAVFTGPQAAELTW